MTEAEVLAGAVKTLSPQELAEVLNVHHNVLLCLHDLPQAHQALVLGLAAQTFMTSAINCKTQCATSTL